MITNKQKRNIISHIYKLYKEKKDEQFKKEFLCGNDGVVVPDEIPLSASACNPPKQIYENRDDYVSRITNKNKFLSIYPSFFIILIADVVKEQLPELYSKDKKLFYDLIKQVYSFIAEINMQILYDCSAGSHIKLPGELGEISIASLNTENVNDVDWDSTFDIWEQNQINKDNHFIVKKLSHKNQKYIKPIWKKPRNNIALYDYTYSLTTKERRTLNKKDNDISMISSNLENVLINLSLSRSSDVKLNDFIHNQQIKLSKKAKSHKQVKS